MLRPIVTIESDPQAIAEILAALIRSDIRAGLGGTWTQLRYLEEGSPEAVAAGSSPKQHWAMPEEMNDGGADCKVLVRAHGRTKGAAVGCVRTGEGRYHVFLFDGLGRVDDVCVAHGMRPPADPRTYEGAARAVIRPALARAKVMVAELGDVMRGQPRLTPELAAAIRAEAKKRKVLSRPAVKAAVVRGLLEAYPGFAEEAELSGLLDPDEEVGAAQDEEVGAVWGSITRIAGTVAAGVVSAFATPAAGAAVAVAANGAASVVDKVEAEHAAAEKAKGERAAKKKAAALHAAAVKAAAEAKTEEERKSAAAAALVTSPDPKTVLRVRAALSRAHKKQGQPEDAARLLTAVAVLKSRGYELPVEPQQEAPPPPRPVELEEEFDFDDELDEPDDLPVRLRGGCPGSCALR